jgi:hypothetical protein
MITLRTALASVLLVIGLAACEFKREEDAGATPSPTEGAVAPIENPTVAEPPAPQPTQAAAIAIQTQPGPEGSSVVLERAAVTGNILTVQVRYIGGKRIGHSIDARDVSVIDDATSNRIGILQDQEGVWMAAPLVTPTSDTLHVSLGKEDPAIVWFKFPAPPAMSTTISINIPKVAPFDGVPVTR